MENTSIMIIGLYSYLINIMILARSGLFLYQITRCGIVTFCRGELQTYNITECESNNIYCYFALQANINEWNERKMERGKD